LTIVVTVILIIKFIMKQLFLDEWKKWSYIGYYIGIKKTGKGLEDTATFTKGKDKTYKICTNITLCI